MNNSKPISSGLGVRESLGETAVGFTYGPPLGNETNFQRRRHLSGNISNDLDDDIGNEDSSTPIYWPIFCLYGNGNVYCFLTGLGDNAIYQPDISGPLPMFPHAEDNYEAGSDGYYKAILCLPPAHPASPPILVTANYLTVYHAIILNNQPIQKNGENDQNGSDTDSIASDWSSSVFGQIKNNKRAPPNLSLHVYESLELNPSTVNRINQEKDTSKMPDGFSVQTSVRLHPDRSSPSRYFCCHSAGIHGVTLPMVAQLKQMAQDDDFENMALGITNFSEESSLDHLIATKPQFSNAKTSSAIIGMSVLAFPPPVKLACLMNNYSLEILTLSTPYLESATNLLTEEKLDTRRNYPTTKQKEIAFDKNIAQILQRTTTQPLLRAGPNELCGKDCHEILIQSTKILRQEYLAKLEVVREKLEKRVATLESRKKAQQASIARLKYEKRGLMDNATKLSEIYDDLSVNNQKLSERLEQVLLKVQKQLPVRSDAELKMQRELQDIERKMKNLTNAMEQIRTKEKYQVRQITQSHETARAESGSCSPYNGGDSLSGDNQMSSIKQILQANSKDIQQIIKDVNDAKCNLGL